IAYLGNDKGYGIEKGSFTNDDGTKFSNKNEFLLRWGNAITSVRWNHILGNKLFMNTAVRYSKYKFLIGNEMENEIKMDDRTTNESFLFEYSSSIEDWAGNIDWDWVPNSNNYVRFGVGNIYHTFTPGVTQLQYNTDSSPELDTTYGSQVHTAHEWYSYIEDEIKIGDKFKGNVGLHFTGFLVGGKNYLSLQPRLSGRYLLGSKSSIKASYTYMTQFLHLLTNSGIGLPTDLWLPATERVKPQNSHQWATGFARTFKKKYEVSIEGYYKAMDNLIEYKEGASFFDSDKDWQDKIETGKGWSYGGEILIEKKIGKITGWVGYTLSWSNRQFDNLNFGEVYPYRYDRRNDIGLALTYEVNDNVNFGLVWVYGTGNAVTVAFERYLPSADGLNYYSSIEHIESRNNYRMPSYHRLDFGVNLKKEKKWGTRTINWGVYNAYNRKNPFYLAFEDEINNGRKLYQYSLFPLIPSFTYNFEF
ncbi:MAG: TonB-dependent receptor, partial [Flavobacteriales bacterium]|nr:TonB-dependent receptor [Flavobacteriales bacterium]